MRRGAIVVCLCVLLALVAAGCGGSSKPSSSGNAGGGSSAATGGGGSGQATGSPVNVGIITPVDSPIETQPANGAIAAVDRINATGGLNGHPIKLINCNDQNDANQTEVCLRELMGQHIIALIGGTPLYLQEIAPIMAKAHIAGIAQVLQDPSEYSMTNLFPIAPGQYFSFGTLAAYVARNKLPTSMVAADNPTGADQRAEFTKNVMTPLSWKWANIPLVSPTQSDFSPIVAASQSDGAKNVLIQVGLQQWIQYLEAAHDSGADFEHYFSGEPVSGQEVKLAGGYQKYIYASPFPPSNSSNPMVKQFVSDVKKYHQTQALTTPYYYGGDLDQYLGFMALQQLVKNGTIKSLTAPGVLAGFQAAKDINLMGVIPPWTPSKKGPAGFGQASNPFTYLVKYTRSGVQELMTPKPVTIQQAMAGQGIVK
jgi:branched-chain amino acid transport system substrate-binding protein